VADMVVEYDQTEMDITMCVTEGGGGGTCSLTNMGHINDKQ
jgi:hypothetical protein